MEKEVLYPVDTASFSNIRENNFVYVDKTRYIHDLTVSKGTYYFLTRPRRFGKTLFLDTLAEYFSGNKALFEGLAISLLKTDEWEAFPVIRLNMSGKTFSDSSSLVRKIESQLAEIERLFDIPHSDRDFDERFEALIRNVANKSNKKAVILIDEYDAPLTSTIDSPELQEKYRAELQGLYSVLKNSEAYIQFCMLTGLTRYGMVSVFSGLNNLNDITFDDKYAGICGITEAELHQHYEDGIEALARKYNLTNNEIYQKVKDEYDGYHFSSCMLDVYNPFSINHLFAKEKFEDYWCRSGVPTILSKSLMHNDFDVEKLNGKKVPESELSDLSMFNPNPVPLFYQTGYLTIKGYEERRKRYTLGYPNREIEAAIMRNILKVYTHANDDRQGKVYDMEDALEGGKPREFITLLSSFLSDIPTQLHKYVAKYENYYHTIFYCLTTLIGLDVEAEYSTAEGFIDILIKTAGYIYIIELKVNGSAEDAIAQIEERHYAAPFASDPRNLVKIGIGFSPVTHNIDSYLIK